MPRTKKIAQPNLDDAGGFKNPPLQGAPETVHPNRRGVPQVRPINK